MSARVTIEGEVRWASNGAVSLTVNLAILLYLRTTRQPARAQYTEPQTRAAAEILAKSEFAREVLGCLTSSNPR